METLSKLEKSSILEAPHFGWMMVVAMVIVRSYVICEFNWADIIWLVALTVR